MFKRITLITAAVLVLVGLGAAAVVAKAVIPGCQTVTMNDSTPPFPDSVNWVSGERAHHYGSYRISGGCGQQMSAHLLGIGPDSPEQCAGIYLHIQADDGTWYRTSTVHTCTESPTDVRVAGFLPINHRFYLHCADSKDPPVENEPCRIRFKF